MGAACTHSAILHPMTRVIQIRDVPEEVHHALVDAAAAQGLSLTKYMLRELDQLAKRAQVVHSNAAVVRRTQDVVRGRANRETILDALREGRGE